jgi:hypothetical protein
LELYQLFFYPQTSLEYAHPFNILVTYRSTSKYSTRIAMFPLFVSSSPSSAVRALVTYASFDEKSKSTEQIATILRTCFNLKSLRVKNCPAFSAPDLVTLLWKDEEDDEQEYFLPILRDLDLEPHDVYSICKKDSLEWAAALKALEMFFEEFYPSICECGGYLHSPYSVQECCSELPDICHNCADDRKKYIFV